MVMGPELPQGYVPKKTKGDFWEGLGIGSYEAANSALLGLPDFIVSKTDAKKALQELRERNKEAVLAGNIVGTVGSMFIPGGAIAKGLGAGAKALGAANLGSKLTKAGQFISTADKTGKFVPAALKGVAGAAEQAIPRALIQAGTDGDVNKAGGDLATSLALGGGIGGALGKIAPMMGNLGQKAGDTIQDASDASKRALAGTMGISPRVVRQNIARNTPGGLQKSKSLDRIESQNLDNILEFGKKYGLQGEAGRGRKVQEVMDVLGSKYDNAINEAVAQSPNLTKDILQKVKFGLSQGTNTNPAMKEVEKIVAKYANNNNGLSGLRNKLNEDIRRGYASTARTTADVEKLEALQATSAMLDDALDAASGGSMKALGKEYRAGKQFMMSEFMNSLPEYAKIGAGSPTQIRTTAEKMIGSALGGTGLGGASVASDVMQGNDVDYGKAAMAGLGGAALGGVANKVLPMVIQKGVAGASGALSKLEPMAQKLINAGTGEIPDIATKAGQMMPRAVGAMVGTGLDEQTAQEPEQEAVVDAQQATDSAPGEINPQLAEKLNSRLATIYQNEFADQMSPEDFMEWANTKTKGFTDKASLGVILYDDPKQAQEYAQKVKLAEQFGKINMDKALSDGWFDDEADSQKKALTELLMNQQTGGDVSKRSDSQKKILAEQLSMLKKNPEMLPQVLANYGLDFADLKEMGVI